MSELSHAIARNIASRGREKSVAERGFEILNAAAEAIGVCRRALARLAVWMADGIGTVRMRAMEAGPEIGAGMLVGLANARQEREGAERPVPAAVRRRWKAALKKLGRPQVREHLERTAHLPATAPFLPTDTGLTHGATRYPDRGFVLDWAADAPEDDGGIWRILTICAIFIMVGAGILFWTVL